MRDSRDASAIGRHMNCFPKRQTSRMRGIFPPAAFLLAQRRPETKACVQPATQDNLDLLERLPTGSKVLATV